MWRNIGLRWQKTITPLGNSGSIPKITLELMNFEFHLLLDRVSQTNRVTPREQSVFHMRPNPHFPIQ